jgi:hypothetical protein
MEASSSRLYLYMSQFLPDELEKLLKESGVPYKRNSRSFLLDCPRCNKKQKLWILKSNGAFVCWLCMETDNFKGFADVALSEILGKDIREIRGRIFEGAIPPGNELAFTLSEFGEGDLVDVPQDLFKAEEIVLGPDVVELTSKAGAKGVAYLEGRGIPLDVALKYGIMYWPFCKRVVFPVKQDGRLVGYQARSIVADGRPKILTSTGLRREYAMMFQDNLLGQDHAVICEGPVDAIKADLCGGNVATMGKAVTKTQLEIVRRLGIKTVYLALDPDAAEEVNRLAFELGDIETRLLLPPKGKKDLGECSFEEVYEAFREAQPFMAGNLLLSLRT